MDDGASNGDALLLAPRQLRRPMLTSVAQTHSLEGFHGLLSRIVWSIPVQQEGQLHVLDGGQNREEVEILENESKMLASQIGALVI